MVRALGFIFPRWGRQVFWGLWTAGLATVAGMLLGILPCSSLALGAIVVFLGITIAIGVMSQDCGFFARPLNRVERTDNRLAITFDDGPDKEFTPQILDLLASFGQRATFFVIGDKVRRCPELARRIIDEGHELGNHTTRHSWHMALWPVSQIARDLMQNVEVIQEVTGVTPTLFRPPAAVLSPRIQAASLETGLVLVGYSVRSGDGSPAVSATRALKRLQKGLYAGSILLLHDGASTGRSLQILPSLLEEMKARELTSVPVSELISVPVSELSSER